MTKDEVFEVVSGSPVVMADSRVGMFLIYPIGKGDREGMCGIQVPGEEEHRWVHHDNLKMEGGALVAAGVKTRTVLMEMVNEKG